MKAKYTAVDKIAKRIETAGLQKDHIAAKVGISAGTLSQFLAKKESYVTASLIGRLNAYLDTVKS